MRLLRTQRYYLIRKKKQATPPGSLPAYAMFALRPHLQPVDRGIRLLPDDSPSSRVATEPLPPGLTET